MSRTIDPFDELAAMFLSAPAPQAPVPSPVPTAGDAKMTSMSPTPAHASTTELLMVGHLPVRAGLWLTPFADAMARELGATALIRLDVEEPSIQLIRGPEHWEQASLDESFESAIEAFGSGVDLWIIRGPVGSSPAELVSSGVQQITILSSGDEAAVVAAYQLVKELALASEQAAVPLPRIGLAVMGVDLANATSIVERLNRTTLSFLGVEIRLRTCLPRMDAGIKSTRYASFPSMPAMSLAQTMAAIKRAQSQPAALSITRPDVAGRIGPLSSASMTNDAQSIPTSPLQVSFPRSNKDAGIAKESSAEPFPSFTPLVPPPLREFIADPQTTAKAPSVDPVKLAPKPAVDLEAKHGTKPVEPDDHGRPVPLATHVGGLTPLPVRCPGHERVELALDACGRMHLLIKETSGQSLRELRIVESWARAHRELIGLACPQQTINAALPPTCHVFTDQPASLADLHGTDIRLHVLAPVMMSGQVGWYAAPLNTVRP